MVFILTEDTDKSTNEILKWLHFYSQKWIRLNDTDHLTIEFIYEDVVFTIEGDKSCRLSEITSYWYRRSLLKYANKLLLKKASEGLKSYLKEEDFHIRNYLHFLLNKKKSIGSIHTSVVNKLITNDLAIESGLNVPKSYFVDNRKDLSTILKSGKMITKPITGNGAVDFEVNKKGVFYTSIIKDAKDYDQTFTASYVQEYIEKRYELRIFFLKGKFFSMAIFSQQDEKTMTDFRRYNHKNPNRKVPYQLPQEVETKLKKTNEFFRLGFWVNRYDC